MGAAAADFVVRLHNVSLFVWKVKISPNVKLSYAKVLAIGPACHSKSCLAKNSIKSMCSNRRNSKLVSVGIIPNFNWNVKLQQSILLEESDSKVDEFKWSKNVYWK